MPDNDALDYWFTEGFGDFLAGRAPVGAGVWDAADYAHMLNRVLLRYASSPARGLANDTLAEAFWSDPDAMQMPYDRGHLFALTLDGADGALQAPLARMAAAPDSFAGNATEAERFVDAFAVDPARLATMQAGAPIELSADLFAPCGTSDWVEQPIYAAGYSTAEDGAGRYFERVDEAGSAWVAGLRPGMRYVQRISFEPGDASVPIVMRVRDPSGERVLSWLPEAPDTVRFQRLELADEADRNAACRRRLGEF